MSRVRGIGMGRILEFKRRKEKRSEIMELDKQMASMNLEEPQNSIINCMELNPISPPRTRTPGPNCPSTSISSTKPQSRGSEKRRVFLKPRKIIKTIDHTSNSSGGGANCETVTNLCIRRSKHAIRRQQIASRHLATIYEEPNSSSTNFNFMSTRKSKSKVSNERFLRVEKKVFKAKSASVFDRINRNINLEYLLSNLSSEDDE